MLSVVRKFAGRSLLLGLLVASMGMPLVAAGLAVDNGSQSSSAFAFPAPAQQPVEAAAAN